MPVSIASPSDIPVVDRQPRHADRVDHQRARAPWRRSRRRSAGPSRAPRAARRARRRARTRRGSRRSRPRMTWIPPLCSAKNGSADDAERDVQERGQAAAPQAERAADDEHAERLERVRDRVARDRERDQRGQVDEDRAGDDQDDVAQAGRDALADAHRDEEVRDREALLRGGHPRHGRQRVGHRPPSWRRPDGRRVGPSLPTAAKPADAGLTGQALRTAATIDRRPAIRAGWAAASIASADAEDQRDARSSPTAPGSPDGSPPANATQQRPDDEPGDGARRAPPIVPRIPASTSTLRQTWRRLMPAARRTPSSRMRSQLSIESVLTMPKPGDDDGGERQQVEQPEHAVQRVADCALRRARPGRRSGPAAAARSCDRGRGGGGAAGPIADDVGVGAVRRRSRRWRRDQPTSAASPDVARERALDDAGDRELDRAGGGRDDDRRRRPRRPSGRPASAGRITEPPASIAASAAVRSPAVNVSRPSAAKSAPRIATASQARARRTRGRTTRSASPAPRRRSPRSRARSRRRRPARARSP